MIRRGSLASRLATQVLSVVALVSSLLALHGRHFPPFQAGAVHVRDVVYYLMVTYVALFAATRVMEARRWK